MCKNIFKWFVAQAVYKTLISSVNLTFEIVHDGNVEHKNEQYSTLVPRSRLLPRSFYQKCHPVLTSVLIISHETSREQKGRDVFYTYSDMWSSVTGGSHQVLGCACIGACRWGVCALWRWRPSTACPQEDLGPSPEMMIQAEVDDRVHAAVEEGQAAGEQQPVSLPRRQTVSICSQELRAGRDDFENVEG